MIVFIGCDVFREELEWVLARHPEVEARGRWLRAGLHNDLGLLERALGQALDEENGSQGPRLLMGSGCLPHLPEIARERGLRLPGAKNCLDALLGLERLRELERGRTMVITPSWLRKTWLAEDGIRALLGWDEVDFRQNFGRYDRILVLDPGLEPMTDLELLEAFELIGVPLEVEPLDLGHFEKFATDVLS
ncbi:MAG: DUF1638 domain-containing protein [Deltaproteobacteria bacterium]|jgi:hypothetical protein|nr:DUF1638 domain-containing protein [Deltaproteobacteria bacterium]